MPLVLAIADWMSGLFGLTPWLPTHEVLVLTFRRKSPVFAVSLDFRRVHKVTVDG